MAKLAASARRKAGQPSRVAPAFIDEPDPVYDSLATWRKFRAEMEELRRSGMPHIAPFIRRADRMIGRLRRRHPHRLRRELT